MRVGSGGVMLPHYSPYKVAENFRVLEALYPNRIDLGVGRAPGGMPIATRALQEGKMVSLDQYPEQIADVAMYLHDQVPENHHYANLKATPVIPTSPDMWLLGSSGESAKIAAQQGASFAFAQFINGYGGPEVMEAYQKQFQPSYLGDKPKSIVAILLFAEKQMKRRKNCFKFRFINLITRTRKAYNWYSFYRNCSKLFI